MQEGLPTFYVLLISSIWESLELIGEDPFFGEPG